MGIALRRYVKDLADYREIRKLGQGACGEVYLCEELATSVQVAVKKIPDVADPRDQRSFIREIVVPLKLNLPGIVRLIGFRFPDPPIAMTRPGPAIIISELMPNGTLEARVKDKYAGKFHPCFGPTEFSKSIFGIASTMAQVHKHSAIHRDLKPGNVFLDDRWEPRIADFGLAKLVTAGIKNTMAIGSPMFMAPELFDDDEAYTFAVDVYAFGVMVYTIFTPEQVFRIGEKPLRSPQQLMMKIAKGDRFARQPGIPDAFWGLITECWAQVPAVRPTFEELVNKMLASDEFVFEGTDMGKYREYRERIKPRDNPPMQVVVEPAPPGAVGLMTSQLAPGNQMLADEMSKSVRVSMNLERVSGSANLPQELRRYDFTRAALRKVK